MVALSGASCMLPPQCVIRCVERHENLQHRTCRQVVVEIQYATHDTEECILLAGMRHDGEMQGRQYVIQTHSLETKIQFTDNWLATGCLHAQLGDVPLMVNTR